MFCKHCGTSLSDNIRFCPSCGKEIAEQSIVTASNAAEPRWESKTISVKPGMDSYTIEVYENFGWELVSTQDVKTKDSHLENRFGSIYNVTETEAYTKLHFRRNKNRRNYNILAELEEEYEAHDSKHEYPSKTSTVLYLLGGWFLLIDGIIVTVNNIGSVFKNPANLILVAPMILVTIGGLVLIKKAKKKDADYKKAYAAVIEAEANDFEVRNRILEEAKQYV